MLQFYLKRKIVKQIKKLTDVRIYAHDIWWHHELHVKALISIFCLGLVLVLLLGVWSLMRLPVGLLAVSACRCTRSDHSWFLTKVMIEKLSTGNIILEFRVTLSQRLVHFRVLRIL